MPDLIPPHGGLTEPVCCTVGPDEIDNFKKEAATLTKVPVSDADLSAVYRFGEPSSDAHQRMKVAMALEGLP